MTSPPPPGLPGYPGVPPVHPGMAVPPPQQPQKRNGPLILGLVGGLLALCLVGVCGVAVVGAVVVNKDKKDTPRAAAGSTYSPPEPVPTTTPAPPPPPPAPARIGQCIGVDTDGNFLGIGNCNGTSGTYQVVSVDYDQRTCADPESPYITVNGYRLCLEHHLVRFFCYKFPKGQGWVVPASKCKAKGTVHVIDIVPGASNSDRCTRDRKWNRWYRFTHPTVVYCVMQY